MYHISLNNSISFETLLHLMDEHSCSDSSYSVFDKHGVSKDKKRMPDRKWSVTENK